LEIAVEFLEGKSQSEMFWKVDRSKFTDTEIATILEKNSFGLEWAEDKALEDMEPFKTKWILNKGSAIAVYMSLDRPPCLWILTRQFNEFNDALQKAKQKKALEGL
jgi:hypothetical protein